MTLTEQIELQFIGSDYKGEEETERLLGEIVGAPAKCYDVVIDDGVDDDETEDVYIMRACFCFDGDPTIVRLYYGDVTEEICYVDVAEPAI